MHEILKSMSHFSEFACYQILKKNYKHTPALFFHKTHISVEKYKVTIFSVQHRRSTPKATYLNQTTKIP